MGVDAVMYVRVPYEIERGEVRRASYLLASTIGHCNFFIEDHNNHALRIVEEGDEYWYEGCPASRLVREGSTLLEVSWLNRYYGEGYERGNWLAIKATAEWLERYFPDSEVFYGGDCDDVVHLFGPAEREKMHEYFLDNERRPYIYGFKIRC